MPTLSTKKLASRLPAALSLDTFYTAGVAQSSWGPNARFYDGSSEGETWAQPIGLNTLAINTANQGTVTGTTGASVMILGSQQVGDCEVSLIFSVTSTNDSPGVILRKQSGLLTYYRVLMQSTTIGIVATVAGRSTTIAQPAFTWTAGTFYRMRARVIGVNPTTFFVKVWAISGAEPASWTWVGPDTSSGISAPGGYGIFCKPFTATDVLTVDSFIATGAAPVRRILGGRLNFAVGNILGGRFVLQVLRNRRVPGRFLLSAQDTWFLGGRFRLHVTNPSLILGGRYKLQVLRSKKLTSRLLFSAQNSPFLSGRYKLVSSVKDKRLPGRYILQTGHQYSIGGRFLLTGPPPFPTLPPGASSFSYYGDNVVPVIPTGEYMVSGVPIDAPLVCTAPQSEAGNVILAGSTFFLLFAYTIYTLGVFPSGSIVSLTFAIPGGRMVTAPVLVASTVQGNMLSVVCTLTVPLVLSDLVISTQFS